MKIAIVGAGLAGTTAAVLLRELGHKVEIFERRSHVGGNCFDSDMAGVKVHRYGPHGFHTNSDVVWQFVNRYSRFNNTRMCVYGNTAKGLIPIPFNLRSAELVGALSPEEIQQLVFKDYSEKHWGIKWEEIPKSITSRIPIMRNSHESSYHLDCWQGVPINGYTEFFDAMQEGVKVHLGCDGTPWANGRWEHIIYTGSIDEYYHCCFGMLEYRSLRFEYCSEPKRAIGQINECNNFNPWTRAVDHSFWLGQNVSETIVAREYPCEFDGANERFYPKPFHGNIERYKAYADLAAGDRGVTFLGRLGTYKYLDMDDTILQVMRKLEGFPRDN